RGDLVSAEMLHNMYAGGCRIICFGIETGSQRVLDIVKKGGTVGLNRNAIKMAKSVGLKVKLFVMVGLPGETEDDINRTIEFVRECDPDTVDCYITTPYPYTELWDDADKFGIKIKSFDWDSYFYAGMKGNVPVLMSTDKLSEKDITRLYRKIRNKLKKYITV
ncbi:MAG: radical SAM protein, partial [Candidatus Hydrogenedentota bacterium]